MTDSAPDRLGYTLWAVFARAGVPATLDGLAEAQEEVERLGVVVRGFYDVSGLRADADLMVWLTGDDPQLLQRALRILRRVQPLSELAPVWNALGVHREAEFSRSHSPAFMKGLGPRPWVCVYPFVRSYDWYLLPDDERRAMLSQHGRMGSEYAQVQANTVASFGLGDYEWILALEADELVDLVDLMRHLRSTEARRHVREEIPFFTGRRIEHEEIPDVLS